MRYVQEASAVIISGCFAAVVWFGWWTPPGGHPFWWLF